MRFYAKRKRTPQILIVNLIDIFAMLLIFFIVTTTFKTAQSQLSITSDEKIYVGDRSLGSINDLGPALKDIKEKTPDRPIAMNAAKEVSFGFLVQVLDSLKEAGIKNLPTFTQPVEKK